MQKLGLLFLTLLVAVLMRLLPLQEAPLAAYGYDYGLYLHALKNVGTFQLSDLLSAIKGTYESLLFFLAKPFQAPEGTLNNLQFLASVLLPLAFYFYPVRNKISNGVCFHGQNKKAGIFASLLAAISIVQTETYLMFLLKTVLALPLLVLAFKFLEEKRYPWFALMALGVFVTHRTTAVVLALTLLGYFGLWLIKNPRPARLAVSLSLLATGGFLWGPKLFSAARALFAYPNPARITGIFLENENLFAVLWPVAILAAAGFIFCLKAKEHSIFAIFTMITLFWALLELPFYRRIVIYLDLGLIFYAAYFLGILNYQKNRRLATLVLLLFLVAMGYLSFNFLSQKTPLLGGAEIEEIKKFEVSGTVLALSSADAPWLLGFLPSAAVTVFAPGMFGDPHSYEDWLKFWSGKNQEQFLASYKTPLYLYSRSLPRLAETIPYVQKLTENFSLYPARKPKRAF